MSASRWSSRCISLRSRSRPGIGAIASHHQASREAQYFLRQKHSLLGDHHAANFQCPYASMAKKQQAHADDDRHLLRRYIDMPMPYSTQQQLNMSRVLQCPHSAQLEGNNSRNILPCMLRIELQMLKLVITARTLRQR